MLDNNKKNIENTVLDNLRAVFSYLFNYFHKKFLWGIFSRVDEKFLKFLFVGGINTLFGYGTYVLFVAIGLIPNIALICQYIVGILWNFKTTGSIVFKNKDNTLIFKFFASYIITFCVNSVLLYILVDVIKINDYIAQAILILPVAMLSFIIMKTWVFKK